MNTEFDLQMIRRNLNFPLRLNRAAILERNDFVHVNDRILHIYLCFVLEIEKSRVITKVNGKLQTTVPNDYPRFGIVYPGTLMNSEECSRRYEIFFRYSPEYRQVFDSFGFTPCHFSRTLAFDEMLTRLESTLNRIHEPGMADRVDLLAVEMSAEAMRSAQVAGKNSVSPIIDDRIFEVARELEFNYNRPLILKKLISIRNTTERSFLRHWYRYYSVSPMQYLMNLRIEQAKKLLMVSDCKIYEIAETCGFSDAMYFSRCFRKKTGVTPQEFRNSSTNFGR